MSLSAWVSEDNEDRPVLLNAIRRCALGLKRGKWQRLVRVRFPTGQRIGQIDRGAHVVGQRRIHCRQGEPSLQMRDDERRRHDLEPEDAAGRGFAQPVRERIAKSMVVQIVTNPMQHGVDEPAGPAARIENIDARVGETVRDLQFILERPIHTRDHVIDNFGRGIPDAELLAQDGVECCQERFVEVLNRLPLVETRHELGRVDAIERVTGPVEHLCQPKRPKLCGRSQLLEQRRDERHVKVPTRRAPVEPFRIARRVPRPDHPSRKQPVKQGLHERRPEEAITSFAFERDAECVLERLAYGLQRLDPIAGCFDPGKRIACVGCKKPRDILRLHERDRLRKRALQIFDEGGSDRKGRLARRGDEFPERRSCFRQRKTFEPDRMGPRA